MSEMNVICLHDSAHFSLLPQYKGFQKKKKKENRYQFSAFRQQIYERKREKERSLEC